MSNHAICRLFILSLGFAVLMSAPVSAVSSPGCFQNLASCFREIAVIESFWDRTWNALDCELLFVSCVRVAVFGL